MVRRVRSHRGRFRRDPESESPEKHTTDEGSISPDLGLNRERLQDAFGNSADLVMRELRIGDRGTIAVLVVHIDGLADKRLVSQSVIDQITGPISTCVDPVKAYFELRDRVLSSSGIAEVHCMDEFLGRVVGGDCGVLVHGVANGLACDTKGWERRGVEEPTTESTIRGPKEGFIESLRTNTSMLRRRIKDPRLWIEELKIGRITQTCVAVVHISGVADKRVVEKVRNRLRQVDTDSIQESGHLEEYIEDAPSSPFPTVLRTERPDRVTGALLEGRVAILTDGTPFALIVPATFTMFLTTSEDYYERHFVGTALRIIRWGAFMMSLMLPALYIAIITFHQEMLPTPLILSIAAQREGVPFPALVEAFVMEVLFEVFREAGVRLPRMVGPAVSIIGGLVLGDVAIRAGLVSPAMVMIVAGTGIASFATPVFSLAIGARLIRFAMMLLAGVLGIFGIVAGLFGLLIHLAALRSFGVPFMEPLVPLIFSELKDALLRLPWWALRTRPKLVSEANPIRQAPNLKPQPPSTEE